MTYRAIAIEILKLSVIDMDKEAEVFPPGACPATTAVQITQLQVVQHKDERTNIVRFLTGKEPS